MIIMAALFSSCYYDKEELLDPDFGKCDTTAVTFNQSIVPILVASCFGCHAGTGAVGGVKLDTYDGVRVVAAPNGKLLKAVSWLPPAVPMPKNGNKLSDCNISKIRIWINAGALNN